MTALRNLALVLLVALATSGVFLFSMPPAAAVEPSEMLKNPVLEARARDISGGLRCLVCQNESIDESNAELARDLRVLVRTRLTAGDTNQQVIDYIVSRYGDFVLLKPPFKGITYVLWFGPPILLIIGLLVGVMFVRRLRVKADRQTLLTADEQARLKAIMEEGIDK
jgi:cytochrome c-type biogenesis protein CcmH